MSLDVTLLRKRWISYDEGVTHIIDDEVVYEGNITHNLGKMATDAGIYYALWRPEEINKTKAGELIDIIETGLNDMIARPYHYKMFDSPNGWGLYEHFVPFVQEYLDACKKYPDAIIEVSR